MMMTKKKIFGFLLGAIIALMAMPLNAGAVNISDYTAFPPFLPRVVSPNILFMLDYSSSMVRPAYGECDETLADCDTTFVHPSDDYDSTQTYQGYFESDKSYTCSTGTSGQCTISSTGDWNGNWLNWLTMTQFDVLKKVVVGGDIDPAPEKGNPTKLRSYLTAGVSITKAVDESTCLANAPDSLCAVDPLDITSQYDWKTASSGVTLHLSGDKDSTAAKVSSSLPFDFRFYGETYNSISFGVDGIILFGADYDTDSNLYNTEQDIPTSGDPNGYLAPYWDDGQMLADASSSVFSFTLGTAPNRTFVLTFKNMVNDEDPKVGDPAKAYKPLTYQVLFYEGSNKIVFQYKEVQDSQTYGAAKKASVGVESGDGAQSAKYIYHGQDPDGAARTLSDGSAVLIYRPLGFQVLPDGSKPTVFKRRGSSDEYSVNIDLNSAAASSSDECTDPDYPYYNSDRDECFDHETLGLLQDFRDGALAGLLGFRIGIMQLNPSQSTKFGKKDKGPTGGSMPDGGVVVKHFNEKETTGWPSLMADTRNQKPTSDAPLAEALYSATGYFKQDTAFQMDSQDYDVDLTTTCSTTGTNYDPYCFKSAAQRVPCAKSYVLLISSGNYSHDNGTSIDDTASTTYTFDSTTEVEDSEAWTNDWTLGYRSTDDAGAEHTKANEGWLDNVAYKAHTEDWRSGLDGKQNINLYVVNTFGAGSGEGTEILKKAARYGGFEDLDDPDESDSETYAEDTYDDGACGTDPNDAPDEADRDCDGVPDTYFEASGGGDLKDKITDAVLDILKNSASGTSVSVLSTSAGGEGALYQAYFYPARVEEDKKTEDREWPGFLRSFFIDRYQNLREDSTTNAASGDSAPDKRLIVADDRAAVMKLNTATNEVEVDLVTQGESPLPDTYTADATVKMDNAPSLWEAGEELALLDKASRNIYHWFDDDDDGIVDDGDFASFSNPGSGENLEFTTSSTYNTASILQPYLQAADTAEATDIIDFIRGNAVTGYRNRCIDIDAGTTETGCTAGTGERVWPLGDIVFSTPTLVAIPGEKYDVIYGDSSYRSFTQEYQDRRQMVYVGANDGMLHAFNAGVYNSGDDSTTSGTDDVELGWFEEAPTSGNGWSGYGLGDELWSFVPYDNLPHLAWLACNGTDGDPSICSDAEYTHVYYVDQRPKVTDVQIFNDPGGTGLTTVTGKVDGQTNVTHPNGWGSILVMPMRLGGGAINVDVDGDSTISDNEKFRSAYYCFDVTDPEEPPKLLWRFIDTGLGFSTSYPGIVRVDDGTTDKWFMVVGSGPKNITGADGRDYGMESTSQNGKVFAVDIAAMSNAATSTEYSNAYEPFDTGVANTFMGDPTVVDVDLDFTADVVYLGSAINTENGRVFRLNTDQNVDPANWDLSVLYDPQHGQDGTDPDDGKDAGPLLVGPSVSKDVAGNLWVFFGTGRLLSKDDLNTSYQQRFYGIKDKCWKSTAFADGCDTFSGDDYAYDDDDLLDVSAVEITTDKNGAAQVETDGTATDPCGGSTECSYVELLSQARGSKGWVVDLENPTDPAPSERVLSRPSVLGGLVLFTTYIPASDQCSILGDSYLYALYYETGTAFIEDVVGEKTVDGTDYVKERTSLGKGMPTSVGVAIGETVSGFVQKSTGEIKRITTKPGLGVKSGVLSWRQGEGGGTEVETIYKRINK